MRKYIKQHPFISSTILGLTIFCVGFIFSQDDPAEAAMTIGAFICMISSLAGLGRFIEKEESKFSNNQLDE